MKTNTENVNLNRIYTIKQRFVYEKYWKNTKILNTQSGRERIS
jgi:hypothetical protein